MSTPNESVKALPIASLEPGSSPAVDCFGTAFPVLPAGADDYNAVIQDALVDGRVLGCFESTQDGRYVLVGESAASGKIVALAFSKPQVLSKITFDRICEQHDRTHRGAAATIAALGVVRAGGPKVQRQGLIADLFGSAQTLAEDRPRKPTFAEKRAEIAVIEELVRQDEAALDA
jgi:hypothetical protein